MLRVDTLRSAHELDRLRGRWEHLTQSSGTLFQSWELNRRAAAWFADREAPNVVVAESDSGLAIIPAVRREHELGLIGETLFDYRDVLSGGDPEVLAAAWRELAWTRLPLQVTALRGQPTCERWSHLTVTPFCNAPMTRGCDVRAEQFVSAHHKSAKASRRLAREGLRLTNESAGMRAAAEWIYRRKSEWQGASENLFLDRRRQEFMLTIVNDGLYGCTIWRYLTDAGDISAALVTFDYAGVRHCYTIHYDSRWERFSPGQVLLFDVTRQALSEGLDVDFMTGEYPYKNRLATTTVPLYRVRASAAQMARWGAELRLTA